MKTAIHPIEWHSFNTHTFFCNMPPNNKNYRQSFQSINVSDTIIHQTKFIFKTAIMSTINSSLQNRPNYLIYYTIPYSIPPKRPQYKRCLCN